MKNNKLENKIIVPNKLSIKKKKKLIGEKNYIAIATCLIVNGNETLNLLE